MSDKSVSDNKDNTTLEQVTRDLFGSRPNIWILKFLAKIAGGIGILLSLAFGAQVFLFNNLTEGLRGQFMLVRESVTDYRTDVANLESKVDSSLEKISRIEASTTAIRSILVQSYDDQVPFPNFSNRYLDIEPMGGSGAEVVPGFIPMENLLSPSTSIEELEIAKGLLAEQYRAILLSQSAPKFDPRTQEIEVIHKLVRDAPTGDVRLWIVVYVVERT